jgi:hypothetical protein
MQAGHEPQSDLMPILEQLKADKWPERNALLARHSAPDKIIF